jgi:hypothetical protein
MMKKITLLFALLTISISFGQTNLLVNGDFETGVTTGAGWSDGNAGSYQTQGVVNGGSVGAGAYIADVAPQSGANYAAKKTGSSALIQAVDVTAGKKYIMNFWFYNSFNTNAIMARIRNYTGDANGDFIDLTTIVDDNGANATDATKYGTRQPDGRVWKEAKFSFVVPTGVTKVRFLYWSNDTGFNFMDNASMVEDTTASLEDLSRFNFSVYPNPVANKLQVNASEKISKIEIYNIIGQKVIDKKINETNNRIDVSQLNKGIYILKTFIGDSVGTKRFIKE